MNKSATNPAIIGKPAPEFQIDKWVQGEARSLQQLQGQIVVVEVFQVNCPGCFLHALPEIARLHEKYHGDVTCIGLATAFEDFDINTEANLRLMVDKGELTGEPLRQLTAAKILDNGKLDYTLEFAIALDTLEPAQTDTSTDAVRAFILSQIPEFDSMLDNDKAIIIQNARNFLAARTHSPLTFSQYQLQGTPSSIVIDQQNVLRDISFGNTNHLEPLILQLLEQA